MHHSEGVHVEADTTFVHSEVTNMQLCKTVPLICYYPHWRPYKYILLLMLTPQASFSGCLFMRMCVWVESFSDQLAINF